MYENENDLLTKSGDAFILRCIDEYNRYKRDRFQVQTNGIFVWLEIIEK